jgi:hypothetical protein
MMKRPNSWEKRYRRCAKGGRFVKQHYSSWAWVSRMTGKPRCYEAVAPLFRQGPENCRAISLGFLALPRTTHGLQPRLLNDSGRSSLDSVMISLMVQLHGVKEIRITITISRKVATRLKVWFMYGSLLIHDRQGLARAL